MSTDHDHPVEDRAEARLGVVARVREDLATVFERDPAARSSWEVVLAYPGFHAILVHRAAHWLWDRGWTTTARVTSHVGRFLTGIEIHPGARIGRRFFIDHGMGVVIGETSEIGDDVTLYQGVTLGGTSTHRGKRHPTIEDSVVVFSGAKVLGPVNVGRHSKVGAGSVVVTSVPAHSTVVGIPGKVVKTEGKHRPTGEAIIELDSADLPDPVSRALTTLVEHVEKLERRVEELSSKAEAPRDELPRREPPSDPDAVRSDADKVRKIRGA